MKYIPKDIAFVMHSLVPLFQETYEQLLNFRKSGTVSYAALDFNSIAEERSAEFSDFVTSLPATNSSMLQYVRGNSTLTSIIEVIYHFSVRGPKLAFILTENKGGNLEIWVVIINSQERSDSELIRRWNFFLKMRKELSFSLGILRKRKVNGVWRRVRIFNAIDGCDFFLKWSEYCKENVKEKGGST